MRIIAKLADTVLGWYGANVPYHRGRWRLTTFLSRFAAPAWDQVRIIRRAGLVLEAELLHDEVARVAYTDHEFDPYESTFLKQTVRPGWICFDVGANTGYYSLILSHLVGQSGRVVGFEPIDFTIRKARRNLELNNVINVTLVNEAVGDSLGKVSVCQEGDNRSGKAFVTKNGDRLVPQTTVDACMERFGLRRLDFLKADVEGYEMHVLRGAEKAVARYHPMLLLEMSSYMLRRAGSSAEAMLDWLADNQYQAHIFTSHGVEPFKKIPQGVAFINVVGY